MALRRASAKRTAEYPPVPESANRRRIGRRAAGFHQPETKPEKETEYDGHERSDRGV